MQDLSYRNILIWRAMWLVFSYFSCRPRYNSIYFYSAIIINKENRGAMEVLVEGTRIMQVEKLLRERDIGYEVVVSDTTGVSGGPRRVRSPVSANRLRSPLSTLIVFFLIFEIRLLV